MVEKSCAIHSPYNTRVQYSSHGSRAWGFASADSDYNVRFIYVRPTDWYLSIDIEDKRDVIERPIKDDLDISGWDLRKALRLLRKSNPPLLEWLQSPIIYREQLAVVDPFRRLAADFYSPRATYFHYFHMAQGNFREYLRGEIVWHKKYFYVLRPLLAMRWIEQGLGLVPIEFQELLDATVTDGDLRGAIEELLLAKRGGAELDRSPRIPAIGDFVEQEIKRLELLQGTHPVGTGDSSSLNTYFRDTLAVVWG